MLESSIDKIKVGEVVFYKDKQYTVYENTGEYALLQPQIGRNVKVPFYNCNSIKNEQGSYY